jgi:hypothetical protein
MVDDTYIVDGPGKRRAIGQIALHDLQLKPVQVVSIAVPPDQDAGRDPLLYQGSYDGRSDEAGRAGYKYFLIVCQEVRLSIEEVGVKRGGLGTERKYCDYGDNSGDSNLLAHPLGRLGRAFAEFHATAIPHAYFHRIVARVKAPSMQPTSRPASRLFCTVIKETMRSQCGT